MCIHVKHFVLLQEPNIMARRLVNCQPYIIWCVVQSTLLTTKEFTSAACLMTELDQVRKQNIQTIYDSKTQQNKQINYSAASEFPLIQISLIRVQDTNYFESQIDILRGHAFMVCRCLFLDW